jgi:toxin ParE1/3/4
MHVEWTRSAIQDLAGIHAHIAQDSLRYASSVVDRLSNGTKQISAFPFSGEMVPKYNVEKSVK